MGLWEVEEGGAQLPRGRIYGHAQWPMPTTSCLSRNRPSAPTPTVRERPLSVWATCPPPACQHPGAGSSRQPHKGDMLRPQHAVGDPRSLSSVLNNPCPPQSHSRQGRVKPEEGLAGAWRGPGVLHCPRDRVRTLTWGARGPRPPPVSDVAPTPHLVPPQSSAFRPRQLPVGA